MSAALFGCSACDGWHLANGAKASRWQVHRPTLGGLVSCDGCGNRRPALVEGEAIPVKVGRWPEFPRGFKAATR